MKTDERDDDRGTVVAFRASRQLVAGLDTAAAAEGISRSDVARRAAIRDLQRNSGEVVA